MKAAYITQTGPAENIIYGDLPKPQPSPTQVLVKVSRGGGQPDRYLCARWRAADAAGVSVHRRLRSGWRCGSGRHRGKAIQSPAIACSDRIKACLGDKGRSPNMRRVDECWSVSPCRIGVADEQAAAVALVSITAGIGLLRDAKLSSGETLFINGGSGAWARWSCKWPRRSARKSSLPPAAMQK